MLLACQEDRDGWTLPRILTISWFAYNYYNIIYTITYMRDYERRFLVDREGELNCALHLSHSP